MQTGEEHQHRHLSREETVMVAVFFELPGKIENQVRVVARLADQTPQAATGAAAEHFDFSTASRPIMSALTINLTCASGTVGSLVQCLEPKSPFSSPSQKANKIDRLGGS